MTTTTTTVTTTTTTTTTTRGSETELRTPPSKSSENENRTHHCRYVSTTTIEIRGLENLYKNYTGLGQVNQGQTKHLETKHLVVRSPVRRTLHIMLNHYCYYYYSIICRLAFLSHHHHQHQQQQQQQQNEDRPSRIPRPLAAGSRRNSLLTPFDASAPVSMASATFPPSAKQTSVTASTAITSPSQPFQAAVPTTQASHTASVALEATKNSTTGGPGPETTAAAAELSGRPSRSHRRSASTWETRHTLADLWTEFQKPS